MTAPFFIVGCPRSGTTLLRSMLDGHSRLAVPPESHFIVTLWPRRLGLRSRPERALEAVLEHPRFAAWDLDRKAVREAVKAAAPASYAALISAVFTAYADANGKPRWGDKTPLYGLHLPLLDRLFPGAKFVHIIRDGRAVASSLAASPTGAPNAAVGAFWWRNWLRRIRAGGAQLAANSYSEIRYEELVTDSEAVLRHVCGFIGEEYEPQMLDYPRAVRSGATKVSLERHPNLLLSPQPNLREWQSRLTAREIAAVEAVTHRQLAVLGYETRRAGIRARADAWNLRVCGFSHTWPRNVSRVLNPARRSL